MQDISSVQISTISTNNRSNAPSNTMIPLEEAKEILQHKYVDKVLGYILETERQKGCVTAADFQ